MNYWIISRGTICWPRLSRGIVMVDVDDQTFFGFGDVERPPRSFSADFSL
jgi:hypothetical protein